MTVIEDMFNDALGGIRKYETDKEGGPALHVLYQIWWREIGWVSSFSLVFFSDLSRASDMSQPNLQPRHRFNQNTESFTRKTTTEVLKFRALRRPARAAVRLDQM